MSLMDGQLKQLEDQLQEFIEELMSALPKGKFERDEIAAQWAREIQAGTKTDEHGQLFAPDQYTLSMHPKDYDALTKIDHIPQTRLTEALRASLKAAQFQLTREPHITLATDPTLRRAQIRVIAWRSSEPGQQSSELAEAEDTETPPEGAFFIVEGNQHFPLDRILINIGRRLDNQLVLEDPHVSRRHAQLRVRGGRYVLHDLGSTAGTRVNGKQIQEWVLRPGDVVTMATVQLIYSEDKEGPPDMTPPYKPPFKPDIDRDEVTPLDLTTIEFDDSEKTTRKISGDPSAADA
jgi:pSer/pThr/pTyr-binding forkhead associated (FHA) protein